MPRARSSPKKRAAPRARSSPKKMEQLMFSFTELDLLRACATGSVKYVFAIIIEKYGIYDRMPMPVLLKCIAVARKHNHENLLKLFEVMRVGAINSINRKKQLNQ
jgi:hypothetical protein